MNFILARTCLVVLGKTFESPRTLDVFNSTEPLECQVQKENGTLPATCASHAMWPSPLPTDALSTVLLSVLSLGLTYQVCTVFYRLYLHPLADFPGPKLAAASSIYRFYYDVILGGEMLSQLERLHSVYGKLTMAVNVSS